MPKLVAIHEVDDVAHWLASSKRDEVFSGIATNLTTYVLPGDSNKVALTMEVDDMGALDAMMKSEAGEEARKHDGVREGTIVLYVEG